MQRMLSPRPLQAIVRGPLRRNHTTQIMLLCLPYIQRRFVFAARLSEYEVDRESVSSTLPHVVLFPLLVFPMEIFSM